MWVEYVDRFGFECRFACAIERIVECRLELQDADVQCAECFNAKRIVCSLNATVQWL